MEKKKLIQSQWNLTMKKAAAAAEEEEMKTEMAETAKQLLYF